ncbi:MAG: SCO family protein [Gammaproteobacteria bacterium]|nr:SCO family protein [Gammaproteobacteria bacterium]MBL7000174.1 SCO family protein [Gammaproteobacteria bacterium]
MRDNRLQWWLLIGLLLCGFSMAGNAQYSPPGPGRIGGDFELKDHHGKPYKLQAERGKLVLLFFGYTSCPDVCPMELSSLSHLLNKLGEKASKVQVLFITVDPERDTPEVLKQYVSYFNPQLLGLTGTRQQIDSVTRQYHVQNGINPYQKTDKNYALNHSANLYLLNGKGRLINIVPFGIPMEHIEQMINFELVHLGI